MFTETSALHLSDDVISNSDCLIIALFTVSEVMRGNFGLKLQSSPKLPHIRARLYCNANEKN